MPRRTTLSIACTVLAVSVATAVEPAREKRSKAEVLKRVAAAGETRPGWWGSVPLKYPDTLDLAATKHARERDPNRSLFRHLLQRSKQGRRGRRECIKLLHKALKAQQRADSRWLATTLWLARTYLKEQQWAHAAHRGEKALARGIGGRHTGTCLARSYLELGNRAMAVDALKRCGMDRGLTSRSIIRLWHELGHAALAHTLADRMIAEKRLDIMRYVGHTCKADLYRMEGKLDEAAGEYQKVLALPASANHHALDFKKVARSALAVMKAVKALAGARLSDGAFTGSAQGYLGPIEVAVTVRGGKVTSVRVLRGKDVPEFYRLAKEQMPSRIVAAGGVRGVDAVTSATISANGILSAVADALAKARR